MAGTAGSAGATGQLGANAPTLSIIGCSKLGRTLGRLWHDSRTFTLLDILNRSSASAQEASAFIGAGSAAASCAGLRTPTST